MSTKIVRLHLFSLFLIGFISIEAQPYRYGKIPDDQWSISECSYDTSAQAIILFDIGNFEYEFSEYSSEGQAFNIAFSRHIRIKFFDSHEGPLSCLKIPIYLYPEKGKSLNSFKGVLKSRSGDKVQKYKKRDLIEAENEKGKLYEFQLDNIVSGSILDVEFVMISEYLYNIPDWVFSNRYPCLFSQISYTIPQFMDVTKQIGITDDLNRVSLKKTSDPAVYPNMSAARYYPFDFIYETYSLDSIEANYPVNDDFIMKSYVVSLNISSISNQPEPVRIQYYIPSPPVAK